MRALQASSRPYFLAERYGLSAAAIAYALMLSLVNVSEFGPFMVAWARAGMLLPLFGLAVVGGASGTDPLALAISAPLSVVPVCLAPQTPPSHHEPTRMLLHCTT